MRVQTLLAPLAICLASACDVPAPTQGGQSSRSQISFIESPQLVRHSNIALNARTRSAFEEFSSEMKAHGAFYVPQNGTSWGWHRNTATAADAKKTAKVTCESFAKRPCVLYATLEPGPDDAPTALPAQYEEQLAKALRENRLGKDLALAVSPIGSYGWSWNYDFDSDAKARALEGCRKNVENRLSTFNARQRDAYEKNGIFECRIHLFF